MIGWVDRWIDEWVVDHPRNNTDTELFYIKMHFCGFREFQRNANEERPTFNFF